MKRIVIVLLSSLFVFVLVLVIYYQYVVGSSGTTSIKYIEPEDQYASFFDVIKHPAFKNKVIYVDFWHTGCSPCIEEFTHLPKMKEQLKDHDVAFLYLGKDRSVPGEKFRWKKMIESKRLTGYHFFMTDEKFHHFWDETVKDTSIMRAFPHYLIVNREGMVVNHNAPRPSVDATVDMLKSMLN